MYSSSSKYKQENLKIAKPLQLNYINKMRKILLSGLAGLMLYATPINAQEIELVPIPEPQRIRALTSGEIQEYQNKVSQGAPERTAQQEIELVPIPEPPTIESLSPEQIQKYFSGEGNMSMPPVQLVPLPTQILERIRPHLGEEGIDHGVGARTLEDRISSGEPEIQVEQLDDGTISGHKPKERTLKSLIKEALCRARDFVISESNFPDYFTFDRKSGLLEIGEKPMDNSISIYAKADIKSLFGEILEKNKSVIGSSGGPWIALYDEEGHAELFIPKRGMSHQGYGDIGTLAMLSGEYKPIKELGGIPGIRYQETAEFQEFISEKFYDLIEVLAGIKNSVIDASGAYTFKKKREFGNALMANFEHEKGSNKARFSFFGANPLLKLMNAHAHTPETNERYRNFISDCKPGIYQIHVRATTQ